MKTKSVVIEL